MVDMKFKVSAQVGLLGGSLPADEIPQEMGSGAGTRDGAVNHYEMISKDAVCSPI